MKSFYRYIFVISAVLCAVDRAQAAFIVSAVVVITPAGGGLLNYEYTLDVDSQSEFAAIDLAIDVASNANLSSITAPSDWTIDYQSGDSVVFFTAPFDGSGDVLPGTSALFSFSSPLFPAAREYSTLGFDSATFDFELVTGSVDAPSLQETDTAAVPEPASLTLWGFGALGCVVAGYRRRRQAA